MDEEITVEMIAYAIEHEAEQAAWDIWIALYPGFTPESFVPFSDFKKEQLKSKPRPVLKPWDEIETEMAEVIKQFEARKRGETR